MGWMNVRTDRVGERTTEGAKALWAWLQSKAWSQAELAREMGITSGLVNKWLHGDRVPGLDYAHALERLTGIATERWSKRAPMKLRRSAA